MGYAALFERERLLAMEDQIFAAQMAQADTRKEPYTKYMRIIAELVEEL